MQVTERGLNGGEDHIEPEINQIDACQRDHQAAANHYPSIQDVINDIEQRNVICRIRSDDDDVVGSFQDTEPDLCRLGGVLQQFRCLLHSDFALRETNE